MGKTPTSITHDFPPNTLVGDADDRGPLGALFDPRSLAVVGASDDPAKWGNWIALNALKGGHRRHVFLVNRRGGDIGGRWVYRSLADLPVPPELVVLAV